MEFNRKKVFFMATILEYFNNDFKSISIDSDITFNIFTETIVVKRRVRQDNNSLCRLFTFYIPKSSKTLSIILTILEKLKNDVQNDPIIIDGYLGDLNAGSHEIVYSRRVYFYIETPLGPDELSNLNNSSNERSLFVTIRSSEYVENRMRNEKPVAFISHDFRDKDAIARPIANGLSSRLCSVWYDEYSLKPGDSLRASIENGIKDAKKCILVLTNNFLNNPGWTKKEFDSIFTRELICKERVIIPVWHNITKEEVYTYSPSLADTVALKWPDCTKFDENQYKKEIEKLISRIHTALT